MASCRVCGFLLLRSTTIFKDFEMVNNKHHVDSNDGKYSDNGLKAMMLSSGLLEGLNQNRTAQRITAAKYEMDFLVGGTESLLIYSSPIKLSFSSGGIIVFSTMDDNKHLIVYQYLLDFGEHSLN